MTLHEKLDIIVRSIELKHVGSTNRLPCKANESA
jgi:hypothetical protein